MLLSEENKKPKFGCGDYFYLIGKPLIEKLLDF